MLLYICIKQIMQIKVSLEILNFKLFLNINLKLNDLCAMIFNKLFIKNGFIGFI